MTVTGSVKVAGAFLVLALCAACAVSQPQGDVAGVPSSGALNATRYVGKTLFLNGRPVTAARVNLTSLPDYGTMVTPNHHSRKKFEYVFNQYGTYASIFDYPKSVAQVGTIYGDGGQGCTNVLHGYGKGIFWNVGGNTQITEYRVEETPIKTLSVNYSFPSSCAMNSSGDLAVGILYGTSVSGRGGGDVVIFKNATGSGKAYPTPLDEEFFDGYDPNGNLFADGFTGNRSGFALVEIPKGSTKGEKITTSNAVGFPGSVQWDGTYLTVLDQYGNGIYQYTVSGTKATLKHIVNLTGAGDCAQAWIVKGLVYCGDAFNNDGEVYKYPAGGSPIATFTGNFDSPLGIVAAEK